jgi:hypothetical protein
LRALAALGTLSLLLAVSCGSARKAAPNVTAPASNPAPGDQDAGAESTPADPEPSEADALLELVTGNVASTDLSAVVEILGARVEGPSGGPAPAAGYVNHVYDVRITRPLAGCGGLVGFTYAEMAEADIRPKPVGTRLLVSVCRDAGGGYHTPDNGYAVPEADLPPGAVEALAARPPAKAGSVCGQ